MADSRYECTHTYVKNLFILIPSVVKVEFKNCTLTSNTIFLLRRWWPRFMNRVARWFVFKPKIPFLVNFVGSCIRRCWYILWPFGIFCCQLVDLMAICYILCSFDTYFPVLVYCTKPNLATLFMNACIQMYIPVKTLTFDCNVQFWKNMLFNVTNTCNVFIVSYTCNVFNVTCTCNVCACFVIVCNYS
jgi:hypothetical protein